MWHGEIPINTLNNDALTLSPTYVELCLEQPGFLLPWARGHPLGRICTTAPGTACLAAIS